MIRMCLCASVSISRFRCLFVCLPACASRVSVCRVCLSCVSSVCLCVSMCVACSAKNACDNLSGFHVLDRYLIVLYYQPNKQTKKVPPLTSLPACLPACLRTCVWVGGGVADVGRCIAGLPATASICGPISVDIWTDIELMCDGLVTCAYSHAHTLPIVPITSSLSHAAVSCCSCECTQVSLDKQAAQVEQMKAKWNVEGTKAK